MSACQTQVIVSPSQCNVIEVCTPGPQGPTGPMGNPGIPGPTGPGPGGSGSVVYNSVLYVTLAAGVQDLGAMPPVGYYQNLTNLLVLTPNAAGSTISGLLGATQNGFSILMVNTSATIPIFFEVNSASSSSNSFNGTGTVGILASGTTASWLSSYGWFFT